VNELPAVLTVPEAAELLRIGRGAAYEAIRRGDIPSIRIGRSLRVPRCQIVELLEGGEAAEMSGAGLKSP
jgi:excisionase family DNA binding protein